MTCLAWLVSFVSNMDISKSHTVFFDVPLHKWPDKSFSCQAQNFLYTHMSHVIVQVGEDSLSIAGW